MFKSEVKKETFDYEEAQFGTNEMLDLKEDIMGCQGILDDLRTISWRMDDRRDEIDPEDIANLLRGLDTLYEMKFRKLWDTVNTL